MFLIQDTNVPGVRLLKPQIRSDSRGYLLKTLHSQFFVEHGMRSDFVEQYYSVSHRSVVRGMHFQIPPRDHAKLVTCLVGEILDVVLDLRFGSPTYLRCSSFELTGKVGDLLYIPAGCAHGFLSHSEESIVLYNVTSLYSSEHDAGVNWRSIGFPWPVAEPILSDRDQRFPPLDRLPIHFRFNPDGAE